MPSTPSLRALRIEPFSAELVLIDELRLLQAHDDGIVETGYQSVELENGVAMLIDSAANQAGKALNAWATIMAHSLGGRQVIFGSALAYGVDRRSQLRGVCGLQDAQLAGLARTVTAVPSPALLAALVDSLEPFPGSIAYLANLDRPVAAANADPTASEESERRSAAVAGDSAAAV